MTEAEINVLKFKLANLTTERDVANQEIERLNQEYGQRGKTISDLKSDMNTQAAEIKYVQSQLGEAKEEIERLKEDLDRMTKGTWSKEIARQSVINSQLRAKVEKLGSGYRKLALEISASRLGSVGTINNVYLPQIDKTDIEQALADTAKHDPLTTAR